MSGIILYFLMGTFCAYLSIVHELRHRPWLKSKKILAIETLFVFFMWPVSLVIAGVFVWCLRIQRNSRR